MSSNLVSVIVVTYKRRDLLKNCLASLKRQTYKNIEFAVIINSGSEKTAADLGSLYPDVRFIINEGNQLYCQAHNKGIKLTNGEFVLCLNDDLVLADNFIEQMINCIVKDNNIGLVSGCIFRQDGEIVDSTGLFLSRSRKPLERGYGKKYKLSYDRPGYIFGAGGVAPLYRRGMLEDIKIDDEYFDENYGIYYEDLDLSWRAQNKGWRGYYCPGARAWHVRGGTTKQGFARPFFLKRYDFSYLSKDLKVCLIKNRYSTILKNDRLRDFLVNLPWILSYEIKLWAYLFVFEPDLIKSIFNNLGFIKLALEKRRKALAKG